MMPLLIDDLILPNLEATLLALDLTDFPSFSPMCWTLCETPMTIGAFLLLADDFLTDESSMVRLLDRALCLCSLPPSLLLESLDEISRDVALTDLLRLRDSFDLTGCTLPLGSRDSALPPLDNDRCSFGGLDMDLDRSIDVLLSMLDLERSVEQSLDPAELRLEPADARSRSLRGQDLLGDRVLLDSLRSLSSRSRRTGVRR